MRRARLAVVGLLGGLATSLLLGSLGGGCNCPPQTNHITDGNYGVDPAGGDFHGTGLLVVISGNRTAVTQSYTQSGKQYQITYSATFQPAP
jgi:hypothetical protein